MSPPLFHSLFLAISRFRVPSALAEQLQLPLALLALCKYLIFALKSICFHDSVIHCLLALTSITPSATPSTARVFNFQHLPAFALVLFLVLPLVFIVYFFKGPPRSFNPQAQLHPQLQLQLLLQFQFHIHLPFCPESRISVAFLLTPDAVISASSLFVAHSHNAFASLPLSLHSLACFNMRTQR